MEFIKEILKKTLKGECELPKIESNPRFNELYRVIECDVKLKYGELFIRQAQFNLHHKWCEISYRGVKLNSMDKELFDLVSQVEEYVRETGSRKHDFKNMEIGKWFTLGVKRFKVVKGQGCKYCYFRGCECKKLIREGIIPDCREKSKMFIGN